MKRMALCAALVALMITPAAAEWVGPKTWQPDTTPPTPIFGGQKQQQQQGQAQGQQQSQQANADASAAASASASAQGGAGGTGGGANVNVNASSRDFFLSLPNVGATAPCQGGFSLGGGANGAGGGGGISFDRGWCKDVWIAQGYVALGGSSRAARYNLCNTRRNWNMLLVDGIRCDLSGEALRVYEGQFRVVSVPAKPARHHKRPRRPAPPKKTPPPKVDCVPQPKPICVVPTS